jgi:hypothetical protein
MTPQRQRVLKKLPYRKATQITDFSPGDVINFSYYRLPHEAVVIKVQYPEAMALKLLYNFAHLSDKCYQFDSLVLQETFTYYTI